MNTKKKRVTTAQKIVELRNKGVETSEIAKQLKTSQAYVYTALSKVGKGKQRVADRASQKSSFAAQLSVVTAVTGLKDIADEQRLEIIRKIVE